MQQSDKVQIECPRTEYQLRRSKKRRKTISLLIKGDGRVVVHAPFCTPEWEVEKFVAEKRSWIWRKQSERKISSKTTEKEFQPGEGFFYLGESYPLEILDHNNGGHPLTLSFGKFVLHKDHLEEARTLFIQWYKQEAKDKLAGRINYYCNRLHLSPKGFRITSAKCRWGSCSGDNRLSITWRIMMAPLSVIDYVLIHELVHIREKNHSKRFWSYLETIIPDYKKHRLWLKEHENLLRV